MSDAREHWGIVGGGMLGMTLALRLAQRGRRVTILESADRVGGLASAWQLGDVTWDRHYHVTLLSDLAVRKVLGEIGLGDDFDWVKTRTGVLADGELYSVSDAVEFLRFPPLTFVEKFRLGATILYASRVTDWKKLERVSVEDWLVRLSGRGTFEKFWLPLLRSKLGDSYRQTSAAFIWATIQRLYAARRSGMKEELFGYVRGGYARILERFSEDLQQRGVRIELGWKARSIESDEAGGLSVESGDGTRLAFDRVVATVAAPIAARLCPGLEGEEKERLAAVRYQGIVCASLLTREPLADFYVTNLLDAGLPFTGVIEMSTLVDRKFLGGHHLVYLPRYLASDDPFFETPDDEVEERFLAGLEAIHPRFDRSQVEAFRISRVRHVHALSTLGYSTGVPDMETSVPGLYLVNSSQILNGTLNVNETVQLAERAAARLAPAS